MQNRIDTTMQACAEANRKALVIFVSAGDPSLAVTEQLVDAIAEAGADVVEIGVPFSDPMADGPAIQAASQRALAAGTTLPDILAMVQRLRQRHDKLSLVLFSYYNVLLQYGLERLARDSAAAGIDGWLVVDVPAEEAAEVRPLLKAHDLHWITLLAPTTPKARAAALLQDAAGFVYCITVTGVTGARGRLPDNLAAYLQDMKTLTAVPVVAGFGISSPDMAAAVGAHADGVVVGSALIEKLGTADTVEQGLAASREFVCALRASLG